MNVVIKRIPYISGHRLRPQLFIVVILSLALLGWVSQQSFSSVYQSSDSTTLAKLLQYARPPATSPPHQHRLFVQVPGSSARLGNRMFARAALLGLAATTGLRATVSSADDMNVLVSIFNQTTPVVTNARATRMRTVEWPWRYAVYVPPPTNLTDGAGEFDDILLVGYFQSWRYFQAVDERVRAEFRFRKHVADEAAEVLRQLTAEYRTSSSSLVLVGIHVRRDDMAWDDQLQRGYTVADEHFVRRAMNYVADRVMTESANATTTSLLFVVCTDDDEWARQNVRSSTSHPVVFASSPLSKAEVDLAVLASCDHVITTVGTFSWWAGYLHRPDGITVYYAGFPKPDSEIGKDFRAEDFFPPGWIGLL